MKHISLKICVIYALEKRCAIKTWDQEQTSRITTTEWDSQNADESAKWWGQDGVLGQTFHNSIFNWCFHLSKYYQRHNAGK